MSIKSLKKLKIYVIKQLTGGGTYWFWVWIQILIDSATHFCLPFWLTAQLTTWLNLWPLQNQRNQLVWKMHLDQAHQLMLHTYIHLNSLFRIVSKFELAIVRLELTLLLLLLLLLEPKKIKMYMTCSHFSSSTLVTLVILTAEVKNSECYLYRETKLWYELPNVCNLIWVRLL